MEGVSWGQHWGATVSQMVPQSERCPLDGATLQLHLLVSTLQHSPFLDPSLCTFPLFLLPVLSLSSLPCGSRLLKELFIPLPSFSSALSFSSHSLFSSLQSSHYLHEIEINCNENQSAVKAFALAHKTILTTLFSTVSTPLPHPTPDLLPCFTSLHSTYAIY